MGTAQGNSVNHANSEKQVMGTGQAFCLCAGDRTLKLLIGIGSATGRLDLMK